MNIEWAREADAPWLCLQDCHISPEALRRSITCRGVLIARENGENIGWLRYNLFWDHTPFLNLLYLLEEMRGRGYGTRLVRRWEMEMKALGHSYVLTSTASDETAQHFYRKLGYQDVGGFFYRDDPYELLLAKEL